MMYTTDREMTLLTLRDSRWADGDVQAALPLLDAARRWGHWEPFLPLLADMPPRLAYRLIRVSTPHEVSDAHYEALEGALLDTAPEVAWWIRDYLDCRSEVDR